MLLAASLAPLGSTMIAVALPSIGRDIGAEASDLTQWLVTSYLDHQHRAAKPGRQARRSDRSRPRHRRRPVAGGDRRRPGAAGQRRARARRRAHPDGLRRRRDRAGDDGASCGIRPRPIVERGSLALFGACMGLAAAIGPLVGGELTERFGWRAVFAANLPVIAVSLLLVVMSRGMYTRAAAVRPSFDWAGSAILVVGLTLIIASLRLAGSGAWWLGGAGAVLLIDVSVLGAAGRIAGGRFLAAQARCVPRRRLDHRACRTWRCTRCSFNCRCSSTGCATWRADDGPGAAGADDGDDAQLDGGRPADRGRSARGRRR